MLRIEDIAVVMHEANRAMQLVAGQQVDPEWKDAGWRQEATIASIRDMLAGNTDFKAQHDRWRAERLADGWKYGPVKDPAQKTNPLLVEFEDLPALDRLKDPLRLAILTVLLPVLIVAPSEITA